MRSFVASIAAALVCVASPAAQAQTLTASVAHARTQAFSLSPADIAHLGIRTTPVEPAVYTPRVHGYGVVIDMTALAQADAAIATAQAAVKQSQADFKRATNLFATNAISRQSLDAAEKQAAADQAQLILAERQEVAQFGNAPWRGVHADRAILDQLTAGKLVLIHATFPRDEMGEGVPPKVEITHLTADPDKPGWIATRIWNAPADPTIPGRSVFALLALSDLEPGEHVLVYAPTGSSVSGERIPASAVLLSGGKTWCYLQTTPGTFQRLQIDLSRPLGGDYFVAIRPVTGQSVVVSGTGLLLAHELGGAVLPQE